MVGREFPSSPATTRHSPAPDRRCQGTSLVEVLVAIVIFSVGVLAVAALQLVARHGVQEAAQRTLATRLAQDLVDTLRANNTSEALANYLGSASPWPQRWTGRSRLAASVRDPGCALTTPCTGARAVARDLLYWERLLDGDLDRVGTESVGGLLYPTACLAGPTDGRSGTYEVTIAWRGPSPLPTTARSGCGSHATGLGVAAPPGTLLYGEDDRYRRQVSVSAYITVRS